MQPPDELKELVERASALGYAGAQGSGPRAPAQSRECMDMLVGLPTGSAIRIFTAYGEGYQRSCDERARAIIADDMAERGFP